MTQVGGLLAIPLAVFAGEFLMANYVNLLYNPVVHNEIAATIHGTISDEEWPIPALGDNVSKTGRMTVRAMSETVSNIQGTGKYLFRGDTRATSEVFEAGFRPRGTNKNF